MTNKFLFEGRVITLLIIAFIIMGVVAVVSGINLPSKC